jgi:AraC-like DNA-binding protein
MNHQSVYDMTEAMTRHAQKFQTNNWDELSQWGSSLVPSMVVRPLTNAEQPKALTYATKVGRIGITRTAYGAASNIKLAEFSGAPVVATTNILGHAIPQLDGQEPRVNGTHRSFVFDLSQSEHGSQLSADNVQLQLAMDPKLLDEICYNWFGNVQSRKTWQIKTSFGGVGSSWHACLHYIMSLTFDASQPLTSRNVRHVEETLAANLLENWAAQAGVNLGAEDHNIVPQVIRMAEEYMVENAAEAPTLAEIASTIDVSVRNLTMNFKKFRGCTPGQFLREQRLQAAQKELLAADPSEKVNQIAARLSYIHMGEFARSYRERFGELPSETLKRSRQ